MIPRLCFFTFLFLSITGHVFAADTLHTSDTIVVKHTTYVFDSSVAVQKQLPELKAEFYDKALEALEYKKSYISILITIVGLIFTIIGAFSGYSFILVFKSTRAAR
jgi:hypothetical protein